MPVRSLTTSVLRWPSRQTVDRAARRWAAEQRAVRADIERLGYFGSYARGDWGVGSDLDLIAIVTDSDQPFAERALAWDLDDLPVPAELLVYTSAEWSRMIASGARFARVIEAEAAWL